MAAALDQTPDLHIQSREARSTETCPWCRQPIAHEQFEEIQARIHEEEERRFAEQEAEWVRRHQAERSAWQTDAAKQVQAARAAAEAKIRDSDAQATERLNQARLEAAAAERHAAALQTAELQKRLEAETDARVAAEHARGEQLRRFEAEKQSVIATTVTETREAVEQSKAAELARLKAQHFGENQKLTALVTDLQRKLEQKSAHELGEGGEVDVYDALRKLYPHDKVERVKKGEMGADIRHTVIENQQVCGLIIYDSKKRAQWRNVYVEKLRQDQINDQADHAVLTTAVFPQNEHQLSVREGVVVVNPARLEAVTGMLREQVVLVSSLRLSGKKRQEKATRLYDFMNSARCAALFREQRRLVDDLESLETQEKKDHEKTWESRGKMLRKLHKVQADVHVEIRSITEARDDRE